MTSSRPITDRRLEPLARSPLRLAIIQARVAPTPTLENLDTIGKIASALPDWELRARHASREMQITVSNTGVKQDAGALETVSVLAARGNDGLRAAVSSSSVTVECDRYTAWDDLHAAITGVFAACVGYIEGRCERLGVRYINEIRDDRASGDPGGLSELLNTELIATATALGRRVTASMQQLSVAEDDDAEFVLRHGLPSPGLYLLDFDHYTTTPPPFQPGTLANLADRYHRRIESVFAWCLNPRYLNELRTGAPPDD